MGTSAHLQHLDKLSSLLQRAAAAYALPLRTTFLSAPTSRSSRCRHQRTMASHVDPGCIFCKIIKGDIPSFKLVDTDKTYAFLDIGPLAKGHSLVIPKYHGEKLTDIPDEHLVEVLKHCKNIARAAGLDNYNVLQNNGRLAHQEGPHVHFHVIPKNNEEDGLGIGWPSKKADMDELKQYCEELKSKLRRQTIMQIG